MPGPFAVAAPYIAAAAAPIVSKIFGSIFGGGGNDNAIPPGLAERYGLENDALKDIARYRSMLEQGLGRGQFMVDIDPNDPDAGQKVLRMFLPGIGGNQKKFDQSMDQFLQGADFGLRRDQDLLTKLMQLSQPGNSSSAVAAGQAQNFQANQKATGAIASGLSDVIGGLVAKKSGSSGGENSALADAIANAGAAAPGYGGQGGGLFDFSQVLSNAGG